VSDARHPRSVRSYVLREGRITKAQQRAFNGPWKRFGLEYPGRQWLDLPGAFGNGRPVYLEIGFGNGEALLWMARQHPDRNYLGIEVHRPGVGRLLLSLEETGLLNVRVVRHDAMEVLDHNLPPASLHGIYLFFPDPWPKKRHQKRRIVQPAFVDLLASRLRPGGFLHMAPDWQNYAEQMMIRVSASQDFANVAGPDRFSPRPDDRPLTRFEQRGQRLGHEVRDLIFLRR
jgi:tRNA (guanine-N7-)-methyltransferase